MRKFDSASLRIASKYIAKDLFASSVKMRAMLVLGIESSCDETGIALYDSVAGLLSHALHSQVAMHAEYGGVVPELASRDHIRRVVPLLRETFERAGRQLDDVDAIAYTRGPGLSGALLVGCAFAEALGMDEAKTHLDTILAQESAADTKLTELAEDSVNDAAAEYDDHAA